MNILPVFSSKDYIAKLGSVEKLKSLASNNSTITVDDIASSLSTISGINDSLRAVTKLIGLYAIRNKKIDIFDTLIECVMKEYAFVCNAKDSDLLKMVFMELKDFSHIIEYNQVVYNQICDKLTNTIAYIDETYCNAITNFDTESDVTDADIRLGAVTEAVISVMNEYFIEALNESVVLKMKKGADAVKNKITNLSLSEKRISDEINNKFNSILNGVKMDNKNMAYDRIVKNAFDLSGLIKKVLSSSFIGLLIPGGIQIKLISAAIALVIQFAANKNTEVKHKHMILNDLKFELRMIQEKIKDAESKSDNTSKYKLMRIENKLSRSIDKIMYGLPAEKQ